MRHERWLKFCMKIVTRSRSHTYKHVSILVKSGRILAIAWNRNDRPGRLRYAFYENKGWHSELSALSRFTPDEVKGATLYTIGVNRNGNLVMGCPCPQCQELIRLYKLRGVFYLNKSGEVEELKVS